MKMFNQGTRGTSKPKASHSGENNKNGDIKACCEELVELDDVQLATVVGGGTTWWSYK
jgi:hypothetical protein